MRSMHRAHCGRPIPCGTPSTSTIVQCVVQDECDNATTTTPGKCTPKYAATVPVGGACGASVHANCVFPNVCDVENTHTCLAPGAAGASCQVNDQCATGLACNRAPTAQAGICVTAVALGGTCVPRECAM